jgi:hypothetical protein
MTDVTTAVSALAPVAHGEFRVGRVFSRTLSLLSRNFPIYFVVAALAAVPKVLVDKTTGGWQFVVFLLIAVAGPVSCAVVAQVAFSDMSGRPVSLSEAVRVAFGRFLPLLGLTICMGLAIAMGIMLLIVPGIMLIIMWYVTTPAFVIERLDISASFARSRALTKGHRWPIFGMALLLFIAGIIMALVVEKVLALSGSGGFMIAGSLVWAGLTGAFNMVLVVATYYDLRVAKEGIDTRHFAAVFE